MSIDIILPVYNEEEGIAIFHEALSAVLKTLASKYRFNVIYVLDRSCDDSLGALKKIASHDPRVTVLHLSRRFGHQMSLIAGLDQARGEASILMDCDMQHPPRLIPELLQRFEQGYDVVQAIRIYDANIHAGKKWTSHLFYKIQNWLSPIEIPVGAADFRLISRKVRVVFQNYVREQNQFVRGLFQWVGFRQSTIEFVSPPRRAGVTKYRILNLLAFSLTGITSFSKVPLRAAAIVGFVISGLSVLYGLLAIAVYLTVGQKPCHPSGSLSKPEQAEQQNSKTHGCRAGEKRFRNEPEFDMVLPGAFNRNAAYTTINRENRCKLSIDRCGPTRKERVGNNQKTAALCLDIKIQPRVRDLFANDSTFLQRLFVRQPLHDRFICRIKPRCVHECQRISKIPCGDDSFSESEPGKSLRILIDSYSVPCRDDRRKWMDHAAAGGSDFCCFNGSLAFW
jgi:glycosyltransferase involved in cell wall biosynthesis